MANPFDRAAAREKEFHPTSKSGLVITAWRDRARRLNLLWNDVQALKLLYTNLNRRVQALEGDSPDPPDPPATRLAPQTYNVGGAGQDARYCTQGLSRDGSGAYVDAGGYRYDENGLCLGGRSGKHVEGLKPADQMDDRDACDPYNGFPGGVDGWPPESYTV